MATPGIIASDTAITSSLLLSYRRSVQRATSVAGSSRPPVRRGGTRFRLSLRNVSAYARSTGKFPWAPGTYVPSARTLLWQVAHDPVPTSTFPFSRMTYEYAGTTPSLVTGGRILWNQAES